MNLDQIQYMNDVALLGLVKRLKEYSVIFSERSDELSSNLWCDLNSAAGIIDYIARNRDDFK